MEVKNFINGNWVEASGKEKVSVFSPATGREIAQTTFSTEEDVKYAIKGGRDAYFSWRLTPPVERARIMFAFKQKLEENFEDLARLVVLEHGKTIKEARGEVRRGIEVVEFACGIPTLLLGEVAQDVSRGMDSEVIREPMGVFAGITPFNFPNMVPLWMIPIAIACGNTFVLKPSERVPLSAQRLGQLLHESGLPAGVFNIVHGGKEVVDLLIGSNDIKGISFVGSQPVAEYIYRNAANHGKRVQALGGAKNYMIVMPDAHLENTVSSIISSAFGCAGERCLAGSVIVTVGEIEDELKDVLVEKAAAMKVGDGLKEDTDMGPVISEKHRARILKMIDQGVKEGARLILDGREALDISGKGYFIGPTIFDHVNNTMNIAKEEIFGPVLSMMSADTLDEAIDMANESDFGNAACLFTTGGESARRFKYEIKAGMVGINVGVPAPMAFLPFAGWKKSFYGDLHATGKDGVEFFTEKKVVTTRWK